MCVSTNNLCDRPLLLRATDTCMIACLQVLFSLLPFAATVILELHLAVKIVNGRFMVSKIKDILFWA